MTDWPLLGGGTFRVDDEALKTWLRRRGSRAVRRTADAVAADAQAGAPVRTGFLRASIHVVPHPGGAAVEVGAPYAAFVEFGTRYMRARPFLRPAADKYRDRG